MFQVTSVLSSLVIVEIVLVLILFAFWRSGGKVDGFKEMALASLFAGVGATLLGLNAEQGDPASAFPGLTLFVVAVLSATRSVRRLQQLPPIYPLEISALLFCVACNGYFLIVANSLAMAFAGNSLANGTLAAVAAWNLMRERRPALRPGCRLIGFLFTAFAAVSLLRAVVRPFIEPIAGAGHQVVPIDQAYIFFGMAISIGWSLGLLWTSYSGIEIQLRAANAELDRFASSVAHDLKTPLNAVIGYIEAIDYMPPTADPAYKRQFLSSARDAAMQMNTFINDLLQYARSAQLAPTLEAVDTKQCLEEVLVALKPSIDHADAEVIVGDLPPVLANGLQIKRVLQNLIENAIKYRADGRSPRIEVRGEPQDTWVVVQVIDNGVGIDKKDQIMIFDRFERSGNAESRPGFGVGLWECRRIIASFGGSISVSSVLGQGATFIIKLRAVSA